jgi:hypothetical protein
MGRFIVFANPKEGRTAEYHTWYQEVHIPEVLACGPFTAAQRYTLTDAQMMPDQQHAHVAIYEFEGSAQDAIKALGAAAPGFDMSEGGAPGGKMVFVQEAGPRVEAKKKV